MINTVGGNTVGFFRKLFSPLKSRFRKMDTLMQNRVAISVTLAGFAQRAAENELLPKLLTVLGAAISPEIKKKIGTELAIGLVACVRIPDKRVLTDVWGLEGEALRQMVAMLVFSESADSRQVLENAQYSSNPDEARIQVLLSIIRLVGIKDDTIITRINTQAFGKDWNGFAAEFVDGSITGFKRAQRAAVIESVAGKLESLSPRGQALIEELIMRCEAPHVTQVEAPKASGGNSEFINLISVIEKVFRRVIQVPPPSDTVSKGRQSGSICDSISPFAYGLIVIKRAMESPAFIDSQEHATLFSIVEKRMIQHREEVAADIARDINRDIARCMPRMPGGSVFEPDAGGIRRKVREDLQAALHAVADGNTLRALIVAKPNLLKIYTASAPYSKAPGQKELLFEAMSNFADDYLRFDS